MVAPPARAIDATPLMAAVVANLLAVPGITALIGVDSPGPPPTHSRLYAGIDPVSGDAYPLLTYAVSLAPVYGYTSTYYRALVTVCAADRGSAANPRALMPLVGAALLDTPLAVAGQTVAAAEQLLHHATVDPVPGTNTLIYCETLAVRVTVRTR